MEDIPDPGPTRDCAFCALLAGPPPEGLVLSEPKVAAFLDHRPLFPGHALVVPRTHHRTLTDLPPELVEPVFGAARRLARAVVEATGAEGSFVAMNNVVSQSVPHLHVHVVPRRRKDGLRGFFWPRQRYPSPEAMAGVAAAVRAALGSPPVTPP
ncbi:MAG: HIT family protein [Acidimicrobiales bacterium]